MSEEIYLNTGTSFQQPYIARVPANAQTPATGRTPARQPLSGRTLLLINIELLQLIVIL